MKFKQVFGFLILLFLFLNTAISAQENLQRTLQWTSHSPISGPDGERYLYFEGAKYVGPTAEWPYFSERLPVAQGLEIESVELLEQVFAPLARTISSAAPLPVGCQPEVKRVMQRNQTLAEITFLPLRENPVSGAIEKLCSFRMRLKYRKVEEQRAKRPEYAEHSVLASGKWYQIGLDKDGIYQLTYDDFVQMGFDMQDVSPSAIRLFGNGFGMLPEANEVWRPDDLEEDAIQVIHTVPGVFGPGDYVLFYGQGPVTWQWDPYRQAFEHSKHHYDNQNYYYVTVAPDMGGAPKRIQLQSSATENPNRFVNTFNDYQLHEENMHSLIQSGKNWYGEVLSETQKELQLDPFVFPDRVMDEEVYFKCILIGRAYNNSDYHFKVNGQEVADATIVSIGTNSFTYAKKKEVKERFLSTEEGLNFSIHFYPPSTSAMGWLDYLEVNAIRELTYRGGQMAFRDGRSSGYQRIAEYTLTSLAGAPQIWEVTDPRTPGIVDYSMEGAVCKWVCAADSVRQFVAFDHSDFLIPQMVGEVNNQDLHAAAIPDIILITHPEFRPQAERLATLHQQHDQLETLIVEPAEIYHEFSGGCQDVTALRDFVRMLYHKATPAQAPQYLLLMGNGSYDMMGRLEHEQNFIPTFQSEESLIITQSFVTDDYFGLMDADEGENATGAVDLGIGRLPACNLAQATEMVDKIEHYMKNSSSVMGPWRNVICFIADDQNKNTHIKQADEMATYVGEQYPAYNIDKIYLDAFRQIKTSSGYRYPEANAAVNERIEQGALLVNYTGHGGEEGLTEEKVISLGDIVAWENTNRMPVFVTATCEFSRFDDPERVSAGEWVLLNPHGGGSALFTTTRVSFSTYNFNLNKSFYTIALKPEAGAYPRLGDLVAFSKNDNNNIPAIRNFVLLGDPAMRLSYPRYQVVTDSLNGVAVDLWSDTIQALQTVHVSGHIADLDGQLVSGFDGELMAELYDKPVTLTTLANDDDSYARDFDLQNVCLGKGRCAIEEGRFEFAFMVPRDIDFSYGNAKISYYGVNQQGDQDASGFFIDAVLGGIDPEAETDTEGPEIVAYIDHPGFVNGSVVSPEPVLYVELSDVHGVNYLGSGIGHDITASIEGPVDRFLVLNDLYQPQLGTYQMGQLSIPLTGLVDGTYTLRIKAWDLYNNPADRLLNFVIENNHPLEFGRMQVAPNPFRDAVRFSFTHNIYNMPVDARLEVYTLSGVLVWSQQQELISTAYQSESITWDGRLQDGRPASNGVYLYQLVATGADGVSTERRGKVILAR